MEPMVSSSDANTPQPRRSRRSRRSGRPPGGLSPRDLHYLAQLPTAPGIRIRTRRDGFGAQYLAQMGALAWAVKNNRFYYFNGFSYLDHGEDPVAMSQFTGLKRWGKPSPLCELAKVRFVPDILKARQPSLFFTQQVLAILREMYNSTPKPSSCRHQIAIHIRRGDVNKQFCSRWLSDRIYVDLIETLRAFLPEASIGIYSQGDPSEFQNLRRRGASLELNRNLRETFHELVSAPMLIPAPSCLSYSAAILSEGTVLHLANEQNQPLSHWLHSQALARPLEQIRNRILMRERG